VEKALIVGLVLASIILLVFLIPYSVYLRKNLSKSVVGVHYYYDVSSNVDADLKRISEDGFRIIRVDACYSKDSAFRLVTDQMYAAAKRYNLQVVAVLSYAQLSDVEAYVGRYSYYIDYYQILNEVDIMKQWGSGNLYMDEEILKMVSDLKTVIEKYDRDAETLTSFTAPAVITRFSLVRQASSLVDVVGVDIYEAAINTFEQIHYYLQQLTGKPVWVTEFGSANPDDKAQADYLVNCLNKFEKCGVPVAIIFAWNQSLQAIVDRQAEETVKEWILRGGQA
jgi:hypothetical protein